MARRMIRISTMALLVALAAAGCSATPKKAPTGGGRVEASSHPDSQALAKADDFLQSNAPAERARQAILKRCMNEAGFDWEEQGVSQVRVRDLISLKPLTVEEARQHGYANPEKSGRQERGGPLSPAGTVAYVGPPDAPKVSVDVLGMAPSVSSKGCLATSYREVYGSVENGMLATGVTANAVLPAINGAIGDPSVIEADKKWSACMTDAGLPGFDTPELAWNAARKNSSDAGSLAVADAKCREAIAYEATRTAALNSYLTTFLESNEAIITEIQGIRKQAASRAATILSGSR